MKIQGAIFDVDGTLLDSMKIWHNVGIDYLKVRGIEAKSNLLELFKTMTLQESARHYQEEYGIKDDAEKIISDINSMIEIFYFEEVSAKNGVINYLSNLQKQGVKMCIATATDKYLIEGALKRLDMSKFFSEIFTCTSVGASKREPKIYEEALLHLGTGKEETLVFEDALYAIETAKKADFFVVGIEDFYEGENSEKIRTLCDKYIRNFDEMSGIYD